MNTTSFDQDAAKESQWFLNHYRCPSCRVDWEDEGTANAMTAVPPATMKSNPIEARPSRLNPAGMGCFALKQ